MKKRLMLALAAASSLVIAPFAAPAALADDTRCVGVLPPAVYDGVVVPAGADCFVDGSVILGNLKIEPGAGTVDVRGSEIRGNAQGDTFGSFDLHDSAVGGSVQVKKVGGSGSAVQVCGTRIRQDLQVEESTLARFLEVGDPANNCPGNDIGGNLQVHKNSFPLGQIVGNGVGFGSDGNLRFDENRGQSELLRNDVDGDLQCFENQPPPTSAGNTFDQAQGQCDA
jgi:hypothetical protein